MSTIKALTSAYASTLGQVADHAEHAVMNVGMHNRRHRHRLCATARRLFHALSSVFLVGVSTVRWRTNKFSRAAWRAHCSLPAIGWPATKIIFLPAAASPCRERSRPLTLPTSLTMQPDSSLGRNVFVSGNDRRHRRAHHEKIDAAWELVWAEKVTVDDALLSWPSLRLSSLAPVTDNFPDKSVPAHVECQRAADQA